jgi:arylsulfatase A-like enzyme
MTDGARTLSPWRWPLAALGGAAAAAVLGGIGAAQSAPPGGGIAAFALGAGLVVPFGLAAGVTAVAFSALLLGADPAAAFRRARAGWRESPEAAARFAARAAALGLAALAWLALAAHAVRIGRQAFHHMGLAALLAAFGLAAAAALLWLLAAAAARLVAPPLARRLPRGPLAAAAPLALLVFPALAVALWAVAPVAGGGAFGFLGLLKRDELDLAFAVPLLAAAALAALAFAATSRRAAPVLAALVFAACGAAAGAGISAARGGGRAETLAAIEAGGGLAALSLAVTRRVADRDRDGASALYGGGDCDDRDPAISPAAIDVPGNGVDEDCSGADAAKVVAKAAAAVPAAPATARPAAWDGLSLVLLSVDALRADAAYSGYARPITPRIDALAARGAAFENAYALSSFTGRAVGPLLIGRYPTEAFCNTEHFTRYRADNDTLAEALRRAGLATAGVHGHFYFRQAGLEQGFDRWIVVDPPGGANADQATTSREIADAAIEILGDAAFTEGRFFLWAHFMDPHKEYLEHPGFSTYGERARDRYDGEVAFTDFHLGRVVDAIEKAGLAARTAIAVTADHGEAFKEHDVLFHGRRLWEEIVRVPWVVVAPGLAPRRVRARVSQVDFAATLADVLGVDGPKGGRGVSLVPHLLGAADADRRVLIEQPLGPYMPEAYAVIDGGSKLTHTIVGNKYELYDLGADPGEHSDLAASRPDELARMKAIYAETRAGLERRADVYRP